MPDITNLGHEDLRTYSACIADLIKAADLQVVRFSRLGAELDAVISGARPEKDMLSAIIADQRDKVAPVKPGERQR